MSIIYDLDRGSFHKIPLSVALVLQGASQTSLVTFLENIKIDDKNTIIEWLNKFEELEIGMFCDKEEAPLISRMNMNWIMPCAIVNGIIYYNESNFDLAINHLCRLNCQDIQIRFLGEICRNELDLISQKLMFTSIKTCEIVANITENIDSNYLKQLAFSNKRFRRFYFLNSPKNEYCQCGTSIAVFSKQGLLDECGYIHHSYFNLNIPLFTESQHHNTCLNRKLSIDKDGYIKNCPYMEHHYGHISNTKIEDVVNLPEFQKWWHIKKDDIDVCKDCEFRHMCTDCRAFIKDPENIYSQPAKCTYNPYICKWEGEEGYVPVEECGTYSRETGFVPDKKKIKKLNKQIWGDE